MSWNPWCSQEEKTSRLLYGAQRVFKYLSKVLAKVEARFHLSFVVSQAGAFSSVCDAASSKYNPMMQ